MNEDVRYSISRSNRTPSKYVSQAFGFLSSYDDENADEYDYDVTQSGVSGAGNLRNSSDGGLTHGVSDDATVINRMSNNSDNVQYVDRQSGGRKQDEFTIITYAESSSSQPGSGSTSSSTERLPGITIHANVPLRNTERNSPSLFEINPVYEANSEGLDSKPVDNLVDEKFEKPPTYKVESVATGSLPNIKLDHEINDIGNDNQNVYRNSIEVGRSSRESNEMPVRSSVVVEGEVVELRTSPSDRRISRHATWKSNQKVVSDAFDFLKGVDDNDDIISMALESGVHVTDTPPSVSEPFNQNVDNSGSISTTHQGLDRNNESQDTTGLNESRSSQVNERANTSNTYSSSSTCPVASLNDSGVGHSISVADRSSSSVADRSSSSVADRSTSSFADRSSSSVEDVTTKEEGSDKVGELNRRRRRPNKQSSNSPESANDDDGGSSDEDKGVYRESFRKSTWLYIGDSEETKRSSNINNYVSLADLGVEGCDNDSIFGDTDSNAGVDRPESTSTSASELEFKKQFNSVSKRFVKRADSQQEYKRYTAKFYDNVKCVKLERDSQTEFGIHVLHCKPAVISRVDQGSPAEKMGLREGQVLVTVNGVNVLEAEHSDIIHLVQRDSTSLMVEVGGGDILDVVDLQVPVKTGYLQKQTSSAIFKSWKKRYFILRRDGCLYYYKNEQETDPLGAIPLSGYSVKRYGDGQKFGFKAEKFNNRTYYFLAENRDHMTSWVGAITEVTAQSNTKDSWMDVTAHNVGLPALAIRNTDCSGYLNKMGRSTRRWRKRYCVLKDACIYYYKNTNSKEAEGVAHLHGYRVDDGDISGKRFSFRLYPPEPQMRQFSFYTDNYTDKLRWIEALATSINKWIKVD